MPFVSKEQKLNTIGEKVAEHDQALIDLVKELKDQKSLTFMFTVIVAVTLVGTLLGLGGLYISAFHEKNTSINSEEVYFNSLNDSLKSDTENFNDLKNDVEQIKLNQSELKVNNPYLK